MKFATVILAHVFMEEWQENFIDLHGDVITQVLQKKTEPSRSFLQSAKATYAPFVQILDQNGINVMFLKTWRKQSK